MSRRPDRATPALLLTLLLFVAFGMARVAAPVSGLGLLFHEPAGFAVVAALTSLASAALLLMRPVELEVSGWIAGPTRLPSAGELERLEPMLERAGAHAGVDRRKLIVRCRR